MLDDLLYGVAYYPEYIPYERMDEDMSLMRRAGFNLIRVAESTWSTWEPRDGEFPPPDAGRRRQPRPQSHRGHAHLRHPRLAL